MAKLLMNLGDVPEDEVEEILALLMQHELAHYRTPASRWGISAGAIWIRDDAEHARAKTLLAEYQDRRRDRAREERAAALRDGTARTFADVLREEPLRVLLVALGVAVLVAFCTVPFWLLR